MRAVVEIDIATAVHKLVGHLYPLRGLRNLEWERNVGDSGYARFPAIGDGVFGSILEVLLPLGESSRQIWNLAVRSIHDGTLSGAHAVGSGVRLDLTIAPIVLHLRGSA